MDITETAITARAFDLLENGRGYSAREMGGVRRVATRQLIDEGGLYVAPVARMNSGQRFVQVYGGTAAARGQAARAALPGAEYFGVVPAPLGSASTWVA